MAEGGLRVTGLSAGYGATRVLFGTSFAVAHGEIVTLLGRNGVGKTTTLRALMGLAQVTGGSVTLDGCELAGAWPEQVARAGLAYCPEDRGIYSRLSVTENLEIALRLRRDAPSTEDIFELFPNLRARRYSRGGQLSGGEQQMLAIGRTLRTGARMILLDEPTEGLAPVIVESIASVLHEVRSRGIAVLLVEQNFNFAADLADRHYVMDSGIVVEAFPGGEIEQHRARVYQLLGL